MGITDAAFRAATRRGSARQTASTAAVAARYDRRSARIVVTLASRLQIAFSPRDVEGLHAASADDLAEIDISPTGQGLYFPRLDADIYIPALLEGFLGTKRWMASQLGKAGGKAKSDAKAAAARKNGKLGGRPRKTLEPTEE